MKIIIRSTVGLSTPTEIEVEPTDAVGTVLAQAAASQGITEIDSVSLGFNGKPMDTKKRIKEYGVHENSALDLLPYHRDVGSQHLSSFSVDGRNLPHALKKRLAHEAKLIMVKGLPITMDLNNPLHWTARVKGKGKWSGKIYIVEIYLSKYYPRVVPKIKFVSHINHPNIFPYSDGWICLSTFEIENWRPTYNLCTIHDSIQYIMVNPHYHHFNRRPRTHPRTVYQTRNNGLLNRLTNALRG